MKISLAPFLAATTLSLCSGLALAQTGYSGSSSTNAPSSMPNAAPSTADTPTAASPGITSGNGSFGKLDKNQDGSLTKREAGSDKTLAKQFDSLDVNRDGKLDAVEFARFETSGASSSSGATRSTPSSAGSPNDDSGAMGKHD